MGIHFFVACILCIFSFIHSILVSGHMSSSAFPSLDGRIFKFHLTEHLVAFQHGTHEKYAILLEGLTEGPMDLPYTVPLANMLNSRGWSMVMPVFSSSYLGYGVSSLQQDSEELADLISALPSQAPVILIGHSTGCQISVYSMKHMPESSVSRVTGVVLQAPVSDQDYMATLPNTEELIALAKTLPLDSLMPREADTAPITAYRYLSLADRDGDDNFFSNDLTTDELEEKLGHMVGPTLVVSSLNDEYIPNHIDPTDVSQRIASAMPGCGLERWVGIYGPHNLEGHADEFVEAVEDFIPSCTRL